MCVRAGAPGGALLSGEVVGSLAVLVLDLDGGRGVWPQTCGTLGRLTAPSSSTCCPAGWPALGCQCPSDARPSAVGEHRRLVCQGHRGQCVWPPQSLLCWAASGFVSGTAVSLRPPSYPAQSSLQCRLQTPRGRLGELKATQRANTWGRDAELLASDPQATVERRVPL